MSLHLARAASRVADARVPALCLDRSSQAEAGTGGDLSGILAACSLFQGFRRETFPLVEDLEGRRQEEEGGRNH